MIKKKSKKSNKEIEYWELDKGKYKKLQKLKKQGKIKGKICPMSYFIRKVIKK